MDIDLLRTFLEVHRTRHFGRAAENLFITQSAVSARVRLLEETLGARLFARERNGIRLTPAGARFLKHAESILNAWNRASQDAALGQADRLSLAVGGVPSLWDILLQDWIHALHRWIPEAVLQAEAHGQEVLLRKLLDGALDVAFMFEPPQMVELEVREAGRIELIMVASRPGLCACAAVGDGYIMVDWGTSFATSHARYFPDMPPPPVRMGLGRLALAFLLECGGATYLATRMVAEHLAAGRLYRVEDAPAIDRQVFAVFPAASERKDTLERALDFLLPAGEAPPEPHKPWTC